MRSSMSDAKIPGVSPKSQLLYWTFQVAGWGIYTLGQLIGAATVFKLPWVRAAVELLLLNSAGLMASHWLRDYVRRHHWSALTIRKLALRIVAAGLVLGIPFGLATQLTDLSKLHDVVPVLKEEYVPALGAHWALLVSIVVEIINWAAVFIFWLATYFVVIAVREHRSAQLRQSEMARALHLAELRLLKSQLNPHFLFNALNTVRSLIA